MRIVRRSSDREFREIETKNRRLWRGRKRRGNRKVKPAYYIKYNRSTHSYELLRVSKVIKVIVANEEQVLAYHMQDFKQIFPDFDEEIDAVHDYSYNQRNFHLYGHVRMSEEVEKTTELPNNIYRVTHDPSYNIILKPLDSLETDRYIELSDNTAVVAEDVEQFFTNEKVYTDLHMRYKRGCLMYGPPGNGKTLQISVIANNAIKDMNCIVLFLGQDMEDMQELTPLKDALEGRNVIFVLEEISERLGPGSCAEGLLSFLDGEFSWDRSYVMATTNYPGKLEANVVDRPGRFDLLINVDYPDAQEREKYLSAFIDVTPEIIRVTKLFSIAYLKELVLRSKISKVPLDVTIKEFKDRKVKIKSNFAENRIGFGQQDD